MINLLKRIKLNTDFIIRSVKTTPFFQAITIFLGAKGWWAPPARLRPKCLESPVCLRGNKFDYQVFAKVFVWGGYKSIIDAETRFVIDAGANIGLSTVFFARMAPNATIVAVEPEGGNFDMLRGNISPYGNRVLAIPKALTSQGQRVSLDDSKRRPDGYRFYHDEDGSVEGITIDGILRESNWDGDIDLLKVDIEGGEYDLFLNGDFGWLKRVKRLVCEIHDQPGKKELVDKIVSQGFTIAHCGEDTHFVRIK